MAKSQETALFDRPPLSIADSDRGKTPVFGLNLLRVIAIIAVIFDHCLPRQILSVRTVNIFNIFLCADAALFIMISGALLLPVSGGYGNFLSNRFKRVWIPFAVWSVIYILQHYFIVGTTLWFTGFELRWFWFRPAFREGWFIMAITAVYFTYPILSPWIRSASRRQIEYFLLLWAAAGLMPYIVAVIGQVDYSMTFLATFYNAVGYAVAGYYFIYFPWSSRSFRNKIVLSLLLVGGGLILPAIFLRWDYRPDVGEIFTNIFAIGSIGSGCIIFLIVTAIKNAGPAVRSCVNFIASISFGMYLCHPLFCYWICKRYIPWLSDSWLLSPFTLIFSILLVWLLRRIPKIGKYIVG